MCICVKRDVFGIIYIIVSQLDYYYICLSIAIFIEVASLKLKMYCLHRFKEVV